MQFPSASKTILAALTLAAAAPQVMALGINCRGSSSCGTCRAHALSEIFTQVEGIDDGATFGDGTHIACSGNCCAFLQNVSGTKTGAQLKGYMRQLVDHGCDKCGSVPTEPGNNVDNGELTVNFVSNP